MAYCRMGPDSDVYIYANGRGDFICFGCCANAGIAFSVRRRKAMLAHMEEHKAAGIRVPQDAIDRLRKEIR